MPCQSTPTYAHILAHCALMYAIYPPLRSPYPYPPDRIRMLPSCAAGCCCLPQPRELLPPQQYPPFRPATSCAAGGNFTSLPVPPSAKHPSRCTQQERSLSLHAACPLLLSFESQHTPQENYAADNAFHPVAAHLPATSASPSSSARDCSQPPAAVDVPTAHLIDPAWTLRPTDPGTFYTDCRKRHQLSFSTTTPAPLPLAILPSPFFAMNRCAKSHQQWFRR